MKKVWKTVIWIVKICIGAVLFGLGFDLFMIPNDLNVGGLSGLAMIIAHVLNFDSVGIIVILINLPLFAIGGIKIGKKFFVGSLVGMLASSVAMDLLTRLPVPETEPLLAAFYGGALCGIGLGIVFATGASTGGSDIIIRLLKRKMQDVPIGTINMCFDAMVAVLTGLAFWDVGSALYSGVAIFVMGKVIDAVVYRFDYSRVALIISEEYESIAKAIGTELHRGATFLHGEGTYSHKNKEVVLTAVKRQQVAELKRIVVQIDPDAFIIVQEAHQVLGDGFSRYSKDAL